MKRLFGIVLSLFFVLGVACNQGGRQTTGGGQQDQTQAERSPGPVESLTVGDCVDVEIGPREFGKGLEPTTEHQKVDCNTPHDGEVVERYEFDEKTEEGETVERPFEVGSNAPYPKIEDIDQEARDTCKFGVSDFESEAGKDLELFVILPTEEEWDSGGRTAACALMLDPREKLTGPLKKSEEE